MNQAPISEPLARYTKFEIFLILHKKKLMLACFVFAFVLTAVFVPHGGSGRQGPHNARMQTARQIGQVLFSYAQDHNGKYPTGKSSTDIFQQLIDQQYVSDPEIFYFDMPGKTKPTTDKLKPENVCFDVTNDIQADDSDSLPMVFSTGYKIDYVEGGKAHLLVNGDPYGIAVLYKNNFAWFPKAKSGGIPLFPPDGAASYTDFNFKFDPKGRTYQQLTPDGILP